MSNRPLAPPSEPADVVSAARAVSELAVARELVAVVRAVPGVSDLSGGLFAEAATYGPGMPVRGVAVSTAHSAFTVDVHVVAVYDEARPLPVLANAVRDAVRRALADLGTGPAARIDVAIDDLAEPGGAAYGRG